MRFKELDCVVLAHNIPDHHLCMGDLGTVVGVYSPESLEVEFVKASGQTQAVLTLKVSDVRVVNDEDMVAVRSVVE